MEGGKKEEKEREREIDNLSFIFSFTTESI